MRRRPVGAEWAGCTDPRPCEEMEVEPTRGKRSALDTTLAYQALYHFTMGGPVDDPRLETYPPYQHLACHHP